MADYILQNEYRDNDFVSLNCIVVAFVFFAIYSQFIVFWVGDTFTQFFRPVLILFLLLRLSRRRNIRTKTGDIALAAAIYCLFSSFLAGVNSITIRTGIAHFLYLMMLFVVIRAAWSKKEVRFIIKAVFIGCFICAVLFFIYNNPFDFSIANNGEVLFMGYPVNRNKNAYAFSFGALIGVIYLVRGRDINKILYAAITALLIYGMLYSQCRGAFFCFVSGIVIFFGGKILKTYRYNVAKALLETFIFAALALLIWYILKNSALNRLVDGDSLSGRDSGIARAWELFLSSSLLGKIFGNGYEYEALQTAAIGAHMVFVTFLVSSGLIGAGLILAIFISSMRHIRGEIAWAILIYAFLRCFFEGLDYYIHIPLILAHIINNYSQMFGRSQSELFSR